MIGDCEQHSPYLEPRAWNLFTRKLSLFPKSAIADMHHHHKTWNRNTNCNMAIRCCFVNWAAWDLCLQNWSYPIMWVGIIIHVYIFYVFLKYRVLWSCMLYYSSSIFRLPFPDSHCLQQWAYWLITATIECINCDWINKIFEWAIVRNSVPHSEILLYAVFAMHRLFSMWD